MDNSMTGEGVFETSVGITRYTNTALGFQGIMKQRYSDFIVREVGMDGICSALKNTSPTELENAHWGQDKKLLSEIENSSNIQLVDNVINEMTVITEGIFGGATKTPPSSSSSEGGDLAIEQGLTPEEELRNFLFSCLVKADDCALNFTACACPDKISRTKLHQIVRKYLSLFVESEALEVDGAKFILLIAKHKLQKGKSGDWRNRNQWPDKLGNYLQFTLFKENIDSMSAAHYISKILVSKVDSIQFAGTKDKRAVTSQKVTMYHRKPSDLAKLNRFSLSPYVRVGDFEYVNEPLKLGSLSGNNFGIIMRDLDSSPDIVKSACEAIEQSGFINYFGLQRFGSGGTKSHVSGLALLKQDWKLAVEYLFTPREGDKSEIADMKEAFAAKDYKRALNFASYKMPAEKTVLESLVRSPVDFLKAYSGVTKNQWLMCLHAYQSYIWNMSASERVHKYGLVCVEGDLVSVGAPGSHIDTHAVEDNYEEGEGLQSVEEMKESDNRQEKSELKEEKTKDNSFQKSKHTSDIRVLTSEDIAANTFTIKDVILPMPGHNIILPTHDIGPFYLDLLSKDGLSLDFFSKCLPAHRLNGAYRRLIQMPTDFEWNYFEYNDPNEELVPTESSYLRQMSMDKSNKRRDDSRNFNIPSEYSLESKPYPLTNLSGYIHEEVPGKYGPGDGSEVQEMNLEKKKLSGKLKGVQLKFTLPPGTYATMMLREISKHSTYSQYQAQLTAIANASVTASTNIIDDSNITEGKRLIVGESESVSKKSRIE